MKNQITYTEHNGLYYPNLALPEQTNYPIGKYGKMRLEYLKKHRRGTYTTLLTSCTLISTYTKPSRRQSGRSPSPSPC